jgi:hypothetical protein
LQDHERLLVFRARFRQLFHFPLLCDCLLKQNGRRTPFGRFAACSSTLVGCGLLLTSVEPLGGCGCLNRRPFCNVDLAPFHGLVSEPKEHLAQHSIVPLITLRGSQQHLHSAFRSIQIE